MIHQELLFYIKEQQKRGVPNATIKEVLMREGGWVESDIDEVFRFVVAPVIPPSTPASSSLSQVGPAPAGVSIQPVATISQVASLGSVKPTEPVAQTMTSQPMSQSGAVVIGEAATIKAPLLTSLPETTPIGLSPYAPTKAGTTPAFSGMETKVMLEKAKPTKRPSRIGRFVFVLLILAILGGGGAYVYATYVNPTPGVAFSRAYASFEKASSFRFGLEATTADLSPALFSFIPTETTPAENSEVAPAVSDTNSKLSLSGTIVRGNAKGEYSLTGSLTTPALPVAVSFQAKTMADGVAFKFPNLGYFIERFHLPNQTENDVWYSATGADVSSIATNAPIMRALAPLLTPQTANVGSLETLFTRYPVIVPTVSLPKGEDDGSTYLRYQFTVSKDALRSLATDLIQSSQGSGATPEQLAALDTTLNSLTFSNGELWITPFTFLPHKISLSISGAPGSAIPFGDLSLTVTLSGYGDQLPAETIQGVTPLRDILDQAVLAGKDTQVQSLLSQARVQAEMYYGKHRNYKNLCTLSTELLGTFDEVKGITGDTPVCIATQKAYAIATPLPKDSAKIACVDSAGTNGVVATVPATAVCE
jgi:hypothetical protein